MNGSRSANSPLHIRPITRVFPPHATVRGNCYTFVRIVTQLGVPAFSSPTTRFRRTDTSPPPHFSAFCLTPIAAKLLPPIDSCPSTALRCQALSRRGRPSWVHSQVTNRLPSHRFFYQHPPPQEVASSDAPPRPDVRCLSVLGSITEYNSDCRSSLSWCSETVPASSRTRSGSART